MEKLKLQKNRGYLIAGIGALVALLAFLLLPYANLTITLSCIPTVTTCSSTSIPTSFTLSMNATLIAQATSRQITQNPNAGSLPPANIIPFDGQGVLWFLPILTLAALALTGLLLYRNVPFGKAINAPPTTQKKWGNYALIGIGALSILLQIVLIANLGNQIQNSPGFSGSSGSGAFYTYSAGGHIGFWLYMLGMAAVVGGTILLLVQENRSALPLQAPYPAGQSPSNPYSQQNPTGQYPPPQNPYPTGQYPPSQNPYPTGQYPPPQNPYPTGQYPPTSNQPQPPYPPGQ